MLLTSATNIAGDPGLRDLSANIVGQIPVPRSVTSSAAVNSKTHRVLVQGVQTDDTHLPVTLSLFPDNQVFKARCYQREIDKK